MRFEVTFVKVEHRDLRHLLESGIWCEAQLINIWHFCKGFHPNDGFDSTVDFIGGSNLADLNTLNRRLMKLPVCVYNRISLIKINQEA